MRHVVDELRSLCSEGFTGVFAIIPVPPDLISPSIKDLLVIKHRGWQGCYDVAVVSNRQLHF